MKKREERYRQLFDADISGFYVVSPDGIIITCNHVFATTLGYSDSEQATCNNIVSHYKDPQLRSKLLKKLNEKKTIKYLELDFIKCDGSPIQVTLNAIGQFDKQDKLLEIQGYLMDLTERKSLEKQLFHAQKMEAIGTMAGAIAHDFNNLLMAIMGNISLLLLDKNKNDEEWKTLANIDSYARSGSELIKQLLGLARGGKYEIKRLNINTLIEQNTEMFARTHKEIRMKTSLSPDLWEVEADANQIKQVFYNLYANAAQAMESRGELLICSQNITIGEIDTLKSKTLQPGRFIKITIRDSGTGIDEAIIDQIFDPFFTTREEGKGTGLGLASAYGIIVNHKGHIDVKSRIGEGSEFIILLPAAPPLSLNHDNNLPDKQNGEYPLDSPAPDKTPLDSPAPDKTPLGSPAPDKTPLGSPAPDKALPLPLKILLVDDEEMIIETVSTLLEYIGCDVITADNGEDAIEMYQKEHATIDLVILDMMMPDMGGGEIFINMKKINPDIKAILSTGYSSNGQAADILKNGCSGLITKPFDIAQLSQKINEVLGNI
ncbi:putative Histidine kinase [Desulfamplus magnetovallimortis]|uniref:histidine kinase n=2 Tax=Desulfamplus magnetovallimortis TaxID=1246637 RepID=A0A1W1HHB0_9BACT|nr:putative Histidine kinase [Desulfamplus magnetovallimortis]